MKKHLTIKQTNRILSLIIVFLVLLIAVYFVKGRVQAAQMKNELADAQQRVASQQAENDSCDPEENVYVVVPYSNRLWRSNRRCS